MCITNDHTELNARMQARLIQGDLWEQEIVPRLPQDLGAQAKALGALQRRRGITTASGLLRAILSWVHGPRSLRQLGIWAVVLGIADLSETAWRKRLAKCGDWLNWLLQHALGGSEPSRGGRVLVVDGTELAPLEGGAPTGGWCKSPTMLGQQPWSICGWEIPIKQRRWWDCLWARGICFSMIEGLLGEQGWWR